MDFKVKMKQRLQVVCLGLLLEVFLQGKRVSKLVYKIWAL